MTPDQIMKGMSQKNLLLQQKNQELLELVEQKAQAERAYNIKVAETVLRLKVDHPATLIPVLVKGDKAVADIKYTMDISEGVYRACLEALKDIRTAIDCYRSMLSWEKEELTRAGIQ